MEERGRLRLFRGSLFAIVAACYQILGERYGWPTLSGLDELAIWAIFLAAGCGLVASSYGDLKGYLSSGRFANHLGIAVVGFTGALFAGKGTLYDRPPYDRPMFSWSPPSCAYDTEYSPTMGDFAYRPFEGDISKLSVERLGGLERRVDAALERFDRDVASFESIYRTVTDVTWRTDPDAEVAWLYWFADRGFYGGLACDMEVAINQVVEFHDKIQYVPTPEELEAEVRLEADIRPTEEENPEMNRAKRLYVRRIQRVYDGTSRNIQRARRLLSDMERQIDERWFTIGEG